MFFSHSQKGFGGRTFLTRVGYPFRTQAFAGTQFRAAGDGAHGWDRCDIAVFDKTVILSSLREPQHDRARP